MFNQKQILANKQLLEKMVLEKNMRELLNRQHILTLEKNQFLRRIQEERLRQEAREIQKEYERKIDLKNHHRILSEKFKQGKPITRSELKALYKAEEAYRQALYKADEIKAKQWVRNYFAKRDEEYKSRDKPIDKKIETAQEQKKAPEKEMSAMAKLHEMQQRQKKNEEALKSTKKQTNSRTR